MASVDIREVCVNDTITWEVGYLINIVSVEGQPDDSFAIGEHLSFKVARAEQDRVAWFSIVVYDELEVPMARFLVGPFIIPYGPGEIVPECKLVPKHTFVGLGYVYTSILSEYSPSHFIQYGPQNVLPIALTID